MSIDRNGGDQLAELFDVTEQTISNWQAAHSAFRKAIIEGGRFADSRVAYNLYQRAIGLTVTTTTTETRETRDGDGNLLGTTMITSVETRELPPDPLAAWRWLQRRQRWGLDEPEVTLEDIARVARAARKEAERRGISFAAAVPLVQREHRERHIPRCRPAAGCGSKLRSSRPRPRPLRAETRSRGPPADPSRQSRAREGAGEPGVAGT
jgi:hypothetical protein